MADANNSFALSTTAATIFDSSAGDTPCRVFMVINRDTSIWALVNVRGLHAPGAWFPVPPNQQPVPFSFPSGSIEQVSVKSESGTPIIGFGVLAR